MTTVIAGLDHSTIEEFHHCREFSGYAQTMENNGDQDN